MINFIGLMMGNCGYKLQHIVLDNNMPVAKTSEILFWVVTESKKGVMYTPVSKFDLENNQTIVLSQILSAYGDQTRTLLKKTDKGTITIPLGGIIR